MRIDDRQFFVRNCVLQLFSIRLFQNRLLIDLLDVLLVILIIKYCNLEALIVFCDEALVTGVFLSVNFVPNLFDRKNLKFSVIHHLKVVDVNRNIA